MTTPDFIKYTCETLSLTTGKGANLRVPFSSGLNWGQRKGRDKNQAYLSVPSSVQKSGFFPDIGVEFILETDDGEIWKCARRQANGKAIHTVESNSIMGEYFRKRLGLASGDFVIIDHLLSYRRLTVDIYKKNDVHFILDFNVYE
ncbi:hypothetical protein AB4143_12920 [Vibrio breoganii]